MMGYSATLDGIWLRDADVEPLIEVSGVRIYHFTIERKRKLDAQCRLPDRGRTGDDDHFGTRRFRP
jgi:hypothetical protein